MTLLCKATSLRFLNRPHFYIAYIGTRGPHFLHYLCLLVAI